MLRLKRDDGAVAVIVALLSVALLGFTALVVDVAVLYQERRQLQNGADAAALSVGQGCAAGACLQAVEAAQAFVTENHDANLPPGTPGRGKLTELCGVAPPEGLALLPLPLCTQEADLATKYPGNYVVARAASGTQEGAAGLAPILAGILPGEQLPTTVPARAVVRWGTAGSLATRLPVTMSRCRWNLITGFGAKLSPTPPPPAWVEGTYPKDDTTRLLEQQQALLTHTAGKEVVDTCTELELEAPGNFNWLATDGTCEATPVADEPLMFDNDTGADVPAVCKDELKKLVGTVVGVPIYTSPPENGSVGEYQTDGFAAYFVTGLYLNGDADLKVKSIIASATSPDPCNSPTFCISGFFVNGALDGEVAGSGTDYGLQVVQMAY